MKKSPTDEPVLFLLSSFSIGGSERKTVRIVNELHRRGRKVHLSYLNPPTTLLSSINEDIPIVDLGRKGKISFASIKALRSIIKQAAISKIVCINLYPLIYALAARILLPADKKPRVILTVNTTEHSDAKSRLAMFLYAPLMRRVEKIIFGCRAQLEIWCSRYGLQKEKSGVIYNGVDSEKFMPASADDKVGRSMHGATISDEDFLIGNVGQLRPVKNQLELIKALALLSSTLPYARLIIVGDGSERDRLEDAVRERGLSDRVTFLGELKDVRPILKVIDLFVVSSISETFSNAALEAMSTGKAVILSDRGGAREMVQHGVDGYLYEQGEVRILAALIERLAVDHNGRQLIGTNARRTVLRKFTFDRMVNDYQEVLFAK
jgi:glycosyltransferase involved in cell wall biosynthesis